MLDYCAITLQINKFPREDIKKWGIETVRDFVGYQDHVEKCTSCQDLMDLTLEQNKNEPHQQPPNLN